MAEFEAEKALPTVLIATLPDDLPPALRSLLVPYVTRAAANAWRAAGVIGTSQMDALNGQSSGDSPAVAVAHAVPGDPPPRQRPGSGSRGGAARG
ncbi:MAG: hypothetical protein LC779_09580 [Actinobacteria bacterium]|nr:hypothetical protein [Actinomycetota bacterium]